MWKSLRPYVISSAVALLVGGISALFTMGNMDLFESVNKPPLSPPAALFPVVWTILYTLMGLSSAYVYANRKRNPKAASSGLVIYFLNLIVNFFWSIIFFNLREYLFAFVWLMILWIIILFMIIEFYKVSKGAALLQIPYLLWVTFAGYLTFMIYLLN